VGRIRTVKPELFRHKGLYEIEKRTRLPVRIAFAGLFTVADREGRFKWDPEQLKLDVLPWDRCDFSLVLESLTEGEGLIKRYECDGKAYGVITNFKVHQVVNKREQPSKLPCMCGHVQSGACTCIPVHARGELEGKGREKEGKGTGREREGKGTDDSAAPDDFAGFTPAVISEAEAKARAKKAAGEATRGMAR
jgi:hypothetical protein